MKMYHNMCHAANLHYHHGKTLEANRHLLRMDMFSTFIPTTDADTIVNCYIINKMINKHL